MKLFPQRNITGNRKLSQQLIASLLINLLIFSGTNLEVAFSAEISDIKAKADNIKKSLGKIQPVLSKADHVKTTPRIVPKTSLSPAPSDTEVQQLRIFLEPLIPMSGPARGSENADLSKAVILFNAGAKGFEPFQNFIVTHPNSRWNPSLLNNIAAKQFENGYFSDAIESLKSSWSQSKNDKGLVQQGVANRAAAQLLMLSSCFGGVTEMDALLKEIEGRDFYEMQNRVAQAKESLHVMKHNPRISFRCGPCALERILLAQNGTLQARKLVSGFPSSAKGTNLKQIKELSDQVGMHYQLAKRSPGAKVIVPSVVHFKVGHFSAIVEQRGNKFHIQDTTFGPASEFWVESAAIDKEATGFFAIPPGKLPTGWSPISLAEGEKIWGKGYIQARWMPKTGSDPQTNPCTCQDCKQDKGGGPPQGTGGMPRATVYTMLATPRIMDVPLSYPVPTGPPMTFQANFNYEEELPSTQPNCSNLGPNWKFNWVSYLEITPSTKNVRIALRNGGLETYEFAPTGVGPVDNVNNPYQPNPFTQAQLRVIGAGVYERLLPDGSSEVFSLDEGNQTRYYMTAVKDPHGNAAKIQYDGNFRITSITDALGQVTTVTHVSTSPGTGFYKIKELTVFSSPNDRKATFAYDASNENLTSITDAKGMVSSFSYATGSRITDMTTPYGTTTFTPYDPTSSDPVPPAFPPRGLSITFPDASVAKVENWGDEHAGDIKLNSTFFWSRYNVGTSHWPDRDYADRTYFMGASGSGIGPQTELPLVDKFKKPLELEVDFTYPQLSMVPYWRRTPLTVQQGTNQDAQIWQYQYNSFGHVTESIDPIGRKFTYKYAVDDIDLLEARETKGTDNFLLGKWQYSLAQPHIVTKYIDGSGRSTTFSYNTPVLGSTTVPFGQLASVTDANSNTWSFTYDNRSPSAVEAFLVQVQGPLAGSADVTSLEYDAAGNVKKTTDSEGYILEYEYDKLDRPTKTTYPDTTTELTTYNKLDVASRTDRLSRTTNYTYTVLGQLDTVTDPLSRITDYDWCTCGALAKLTDPRGKYTEWAHDRQGRVITKTFRDGTNYSYSYDNVGRLYERRDAILSTDKHITRYSYNLDNTLSKITYLLDTTPTPTQDPVTSNVTLTYDQTFKRLLTATNGWGAITYTYNPHITDPFGTAITGGGRLATVTNSVMANSTIAYSYDVLGRVTERTINGSAHEIDWSYDAMSRVTSETNELGQFTYTYLDQNAVGGDRGTTRVSSISYPNTQVTNIDWYGPPGTPSGDERLKRITNLGATPSPPTLSQFDYVYNAAGEITQWDQTQVGPAQQFTATHDLAGQLLTFQRTNPSPPPTNLGWVYTYDTGANRLTEQVDGSTAVTANYNDVNELTSFTGGPTLTYDKNGNLTSDGTNSYEWDAENRLIKTIYPGGSNFTTNTYDPLGRCVKIVEAGSSPIYPGNATKQFLWCGTARCEERDSGGATVVKQFFDRGQRNGNSNYFYTKDHLGSIRELTDNTAALQAQYTYDPYGKKTDLVTQIVPADFQFAGMYKHERSAMNQTLFRTYKPELARWISRDPSGEGAQPELGFFASVVTNPEERTSQSISSGWKIARLIALTPLPADQPVKDVNLYVYVHNGPINVIDPLGLEHTPGGGMGRGLEPPANDNPPGPICQDDYGKCVNRCIAEGDNDLLFLAICLYICWRNHRD